MSLSHVPPQRSFMQLRPKGSNDPMYSPQRDLAYLFMPALAEALKALDPAAATMELQSLFKGMDADPEDFPRAVEALLQAMAAYRDRSFRTTHDALQAHGWYGFLPQTRYMIFGRLGEVFTGGFFVAARDITPADGESPLAADMATLLEAGRNLGVDERVKGRIDKALEPYVQLVESYKKMVADRDQEIREYIDAVTEAQMASVSNATLWTLIKYLFLGRWL